MTRKRVRVQDSDLLHDARNVWVSEDEEDPFIIVEKRSGGLLFIVPAVDVDSESIDTLYLSPELLEELERLLQEYMDGYILSKAIIIVACGEPGNPYVHAWDVTRKGSRLFYGYGKGHYLYLISRLGYCLLKYGRVDLLLRSFTARIDEETGLPVKQLRGFALTYYEDQGLVIEEVSIDELVEACTRDPYTGERLPHEPAVEYCCRDECIPSKTLREIED